MLTTPAGRSEVSKTENVKGASQSDATYIYGTQLGHVADPRTMLKLTPEATYIQVTFKPPCPFAGDLIYNFTVRVSRQ